MQEKTLVILKPDCVREGHMGEVLTRFERAGFKVEAMQLMHASDEQLTAHYEGVGKLLTRLQEAKPEKAQAIFNEVVDFMKSGAIVPLVLSGENVVNATRSLAGATRPWEAEKGTIRADLDCMIATLRSKMLCMLQQTLKKQPKKSHSGSLRCNLFYQFQTGKNKKILTFVLESQIFLFLKKIKVRKIALWEPSHFKFWRYRGDA